VGHGRWKRRNAGHRDISDVAMYNRGELKGARPHIGLKDVGCPRNEVVGMTKCRHNVQLVIGNPGVKSLVLVTAASSGL
jgi:hypothetical protein